MTFLQNHPVQNRTKNRQTIKNIQSRRQISQLPFAITVQIHQSNYRQRHDDTQTPDAAKPDSYDHYQPS